MLRWLWEGRATGFDAMTDLPRPLREALAEAFETGIPPVVERTPSPDGTTKFLLEMTDGVRVEAVDIVTRGRRALCLSSQAGCAVDCAFCVTGRIGAGRNLSAGEIVGQYLALAREQRFGPHEANVVFMGMGEPLLNLPNVERALDLLEREVAPRRITVSTVGIVPGIEALSRRPRLPNLAVSLCAADDETRTRLMPVNRSWPIGALFAALRKWPLEPGRRITFEYVLIEGVNDSHEAARLLARRVASLPAKVNLIPLNESAKFLPGMRRPSEEAVDAFGRLLASLGTTVTVRRSRGLEADAACGQLKGRDEPQRRRPTR